MEKELEKKWIKREGEEKYPEEMRGKEEKKKERNDCNRKEENKSG